MPPPPAFDGEGESRRSGWRRHLALAASLLLVFTLGWSVYFNAFPGFVERFIPLHYYFVQALDQMYDHLIKGRRLPASQVVRTTSRGQAPDGSVPPLEVSNLPPIVVNPAVGSRITFDGRTLYIPD